MSASAFDVLAAVRPVPPCPPHSSHRPLLAQQAVPQRTGTLNSAFPDHIQVPRLRKLLLSPAPRHCKGHCWEVAVSQAAPRTGCSQLQLYSQVSRPEGSILPSLHLPFGVCSEAESQDPSIFRDRSLKALSCPLQTTSSSLSSAPVFQHGKVVFILTPPAV